MCHAVRFYTFFFSLKHNTSSYLSHSVLESRQLFHFHVLLLHNSTTAQFTVFSFFIAIATTHFSCTRRTLEEIFYSVQNFTKDEIKAFRIPNTMILELVFLEETSHDSLPNHTENKRNLYQQYRLEIKDEIINYL